MKFFKDSLLTLTMLTPAVGFAGGWNGVAVRIEDGDTLVVVNENTKYSKIKLMDIDAPDLKQPFGDKSKQSLSDLCLLKPAIIDERGLNKRMLTLARVKCNNLDASEEQVKHGMAWAEPSEQTDQTIKDLADQARSAKIGLWQDSDPIPPWEFHPVKRAENPKIK